MTMGEPDEAFQPDPIHFIPSDPFAPVDEAPATRATDTPDRRPGQAPTVIDLGAVIQQRSVPAPATKLSGAIVFVVAGLALVLLVVMFYVLQR